MDEIRLSLGETDYDCPIFKVISGILAGIWAVVFAMQFYETYQFIKIYRFRSKWLIMYFIMLNITIILRMAYHAQEVLLLYGSWTKSISRCVDGVLSFVTVAVFASAIVFNIFNWLYQIIDINKYFGSNRIPKIFIDVALVVIQIWLTGVIILLFYVFWSFTTDYLYFADKVGWIISSIYFVLSLLFIIVGIYYYINLKSFSITKAIQMKRRIILSIFFISFPLSKFIPLCMLSNI